MELNFAAKRHTVVQYGCFGRVVVRPSSSMDEDFVLIILRYAVGGTLQIAVFSVIASKVKMNANRATTFPEVLNLLV